MNKHFPVVCLVVVLICGILVPVAYAADFTAEFWVGKKYFEVNGNRHTMDAAPVIKSGRTLIPLRYAANALNVTNNDISWDPETKKATVKKTVVFTAGSKNMLKDGKTTRMDIAPVITGGRILLPLRYVANALGVNCEYVSQSKKIILSDGPIDTGVINMTAAKNGTLTAPAGAKGTPTPYGFVPACKSIDLKLGSRYATVTKNDGSKYKLDLGTQVMMVFTKQEHRDEMIEHFPNIYNKSNCLIDSKVTDRDGDPVAACYIPVMPIAKAYGVPEENLVWDGKHLAIFGYYENKDNYYVLTAGSKEIIGRYGNSPDGKTGDPVVVKGKTNYPVYVRNVPMLGIDTVSDFDTMIFLDRSSYTGLIEYCPGGGFDLYTGIASFN